MRINRTGHKQAPRTLWTAIKELIENQMGMVTKTKGNFPLIEKPANINSQDETLLFLYQTGGETGRGLPDQL